MSKSGEFHSQFFTFSIIPILNFTQALKRSHVNYSSNEMVSFTPTLKLGSELVREERKKGIMCIVSFEKGKR